MGDLTLTWVAVAAVLGVSGGAVAPAAADSPLVVPDDASEADLIGSIRKLAAVDPADLPAGRRLVMHTVVQEQILEHVDAILSRFPETSYRDEAMVVKLATLANLARRDADRLAQLLRLTTELSASEPTDRLASENTFYAIQAFVLGARREGMSEGLRLAGTGERYRAFLEDHPSSRRVPVIRASWIRILIALNEVERARMELQELKRHHPDHRATRRATGEVYRATAIGQPFQFAHTTPDGETIRTADYLGHVLIVHFWAAHSSVSLDGLEELRKLFAEFKDRGLRLVGVNVDRDRGRISEAFGRHDLPWRQYYDEKGLENDALVSAGVIGLPTYFVVDRKGVLRSIDPGDKLRDTVAELLSHDR